jgi:transcriptional regulator with XRE-family HTH domain
MADLDAVVELSALLDRLKRRSGRSYAALATKCGGLSASTLHRYCRGESMPEYAMVERIARACGASPAELAELRHCWVLADYHRRLPQPVTPAAAGEPTPGTTIGALAGWIRPRQLPGAAPHFVGRLTELAALTALAEKVDAAGGAVVISAIGGTAGIGKPKPGK